MKVRITYQTREITVDERFIGETADVVVASMQAAVSVRLGFALRLFVNAMSPLQFAQEAVRRYNEASERSLPIPDSCDDFIRLGESEGIVAILER